MDLTGLQSDLKRPNRKSLRMRLKDGIRDGGEVQYTRPGLLCESLPSLDSGKYGAARWEWWGVARGMTR